jgi:hypothetical protein
MITNINIKIFYIKKLVSKKIEITIFIKVSDLVFSMDSGIARIF